MSPKCSTAGRSGVAFRVWREEGGTRGRSFGEERGFRRGSFIRKRRLNGKLPKVRSQISEASFHGTLLLSLSLPLAEV